MHTRYAYTAAALAAIAAAPALGQVLINEVYENPAGGADERFEYIELYGKPGLPLDGYAIGQLKGGFDQNGDDVPDSSGGDAIPEIDEAYSLDGLSLGSNGFLVLYNNGGFNSAIPALLPPGANSATFADAHIPSTDSAGNLNNDGSSTYVLVRARANPANFRKEILQDLDFDGRADFGTESGPFYGGTTPRAVAPFQRVDEFAWSDNGGKEYVADSEREISDTPGFNPDAVSRVDYFLTNPLRGHRTRPDGLGGFEIVPTRIADESFIYGELPGSSLVSPPSLAYDITIDTDGNRQTKAPTDPNALPFDGSCDPEPNNPGPDFGCPPVAGGAFFFTDLDVDGFALTPGDYNDGAGVFQLRLESAQAPADLPAGFNGRYWLDADYDFDGDVDCDDVALIRSRLGATPDDTLPAVDPAGAPFTDYRWQNTELQQLLKMLHIDDADATAVTQADVDATIAARTPSACPGDTNGDGGADVSDFFALAGNFGTPTGARTADGDLNCDGAVDVSDFFILGGDFGCPN